jgi:hypothetical protein
MNLFGVPMEALSNPATIQKSRLGFHYFPDTLHYREIDLQKWIPQLKSLGASWLVLQSPTDRAIPEAFLRGLVDNGIEPIIHFNYSLANVVDLNEANPILSAYTRWGVHGVIFFDRPNARASWPSSVWAQQDLVECFLERFLPLANLALQSGLVPIVPPLEPKGSYWDTAFLRSFLEALENHKQIQLQKSIMLAAYSWSGNHSLNWGVGGPENWPDTRPYFTPVNGQDQCGFRIFDWYQTIVKAVMGKTCPIILLGAGSSGDPVHNYKEPTSPDELTKTTLAIAKLLNGENVQDPVDDGIVLYPIPPEVVSCNFWVLSASASSPYARQAWYQEEGQNLPSVQVIKNWKLGSKPDMESSGNNKTNSSHKNFVHSTKNSSSSQPIQHYLLLPLYEWGVADWHLEVIQPFVKKHHPTIGFSLEEAALASRVTIIGNSQTFPEEQVNRLRQSGCSVDRISGDGTSIASQLAKR